MIRSLTINNTQVYHLSAGKTLPEFVKEAKGKVSTLKKDVEYQRRLELIQDFGFPVTTGKVRISPDGCYIGATGAYAPGFKLYETSQLSLKCHRGFDSDVVDFHFLSEDYRKLVFLHSDRTVEFHAQGGRYHQIRIPFAGRSLEYVPFTAELLAAGSSSEVLRLDLEAGLFQPPIQTQCAEVNCCKASPLLPIVFTGGSSGLLEVFDTREWKPTSCLAVDANEGQNTRCATLPTSDVTALDVSSDGLSICVGTSRGICKLYDIRSTKPLAIRDHRNQLPIVDLAFTARPQSLDDSGTRTRYAVISADKKAVKLWTAGSASNDDGISNWLQEGTSAYRGGRHETGSQLSTTVMASLEPEGIDEDSTGKGTKVPGAINSVAVYPDSGLVFVAQDHPRIGLYFIPKLGLAPRWCSFLDALTEELEEANDETVYENFQFVTRPELGSLGAEHLIGTPLLRAYMHGYFMDARLYHKLKAVAQPTVLEALRKQRIEERIAKKRTMRLQIRHKLRPVNKELASRLEERAASTQTKAAGTAKTLLTDNRFSQIFTDPNFAIESVPLGN